MNILMRWMAGLAAVVLLPAAANAAPDPFLGTWTLNYHKSILPPGYDVTSKMFVVEPVAGGILATEIVETVSAPGEKAVYKLHYVYGGKFTPQTASPLYDALAVQLTDSHTALLIFQLKGEAVSRAKQFVSDDGKTMTQQIVWQAGDPTNEITKYRFVFDRR